MYGANLRQTSKNAKTLESGIHFWVVLKLWMAKTFEKITKKIDDQRQNFNVRPFSPL